MHFRSRILIECYTALLTGFIFLADFRVNDSVISLIRLSDFQ